MTEATDLVTVTETSSVSGAWLIRGPVFGVGTPEQKDTNVITIQLSVGFMVAILWMMGWDAVAVSRRRPRQLVQISVTPTTVQITLVLSPAAAAPG